MNILNQQKGFINTIPAVIIAILIGTVGYFAIHQKDSKPVPIASASVTSGSASLADCLPENIKLGDIVDAKIIGMTSTLGIPGRAIV